MSDIKKALELAVGFQQNMPAYPVNHDLSRHYPLVDLKGKYSVIDTAFAYRTMLIREACREQPPDVARETGLLLEHGEIYRLQMLQASSMYRNVELAAILSPQDEPSEFEKAKKQILGRKELMDYHKTVSAAEHMAGMKQKEIPKALTEFCSTGLDHTFQTQIYKCRKLVSPESLAERLVPPTEEQRKAFYHFSDPSVLRKNLNANQISGPQIGK